MIEKFRSMCDDYKKYIFFFNLNKIVAESEFKAVMIETRKLPHVEFIISNMVDKLNEKWCVEIFTSVSSYEYYKQMCQNINKNIKVSLCALTEKCAINDYNEMMLSVKFWESLAVKKVLLFQEDSLIFRHNINDYLEYDYLGAPWPIQYEISPINYGNGGFSLRSSDLMIKILKTYKTESFIPVQRVRNNMRARKIKTVPEDVFFSNHIKSMNSKVDYYVAFSFSFESLPNINALGCHQPWIGLKTEWMNFLDSKFKVSLHMITKLDKNFGHRSGWSNVVKLFYRYFHNADSDLVMLDYGDLYFINNLISKNRKMAKPWIGFLHYSQNMPKWYGKYTLEHVIKSREFIDSLKMCRGIVVMSNYVKKYLETKIKVPIYMLYHPTDNCDVMFTMDKYNMNKDKVVIQVGNQTRKILSIYLLNTTYKKLWLCNSIKLAEKSAIKECKNVNLSESIKSRIIKSLNASNNNIEVPIMTVSNDEYDLLLSKNIVFINLWDASCNNAIIECIVRNTPILVNKIAPVVEYLGETYPLYYNTMREAEVLICDDNMILKGYEYLRDMNKDFLSNERFIKSMYEILCQANGN